MSFFIVFFAIETWKPSKAWPIWKFGLEFEHPIGSCFPHVGLWIAWILSQLIKNFCWSHFNFGLWFDIFNASSARRNWRSIYFCQLGRKSSSKKSVESFKFLNWSPKSLNLGLLKQRVFVPWDTIIGLRSDIYSIVFCERFLKIEVVLMMRRN